MAGAGMLVELASDSPTVDTANTQQPSLFTANTLHHTNQPDMERQGTLKESRDTQREIATPRAEKRDGQLQAELDNQLVFHLVMHNPNDAHDPDAHHADSHLPDAATHWTGKTNMDIETQNLQKTPRRPLEKAAARQRGIECLSPGEGGAEMKCTCFACTCTLAAASPGHPPPPLQQQQTTQKMNAYVVEAHHITCERQADVHWEHHATCNNEHAVFVDVRQIGLKFSVLFAWRRAIRENAVTQVLHTHTYARARAHTHAYTHTHTHTHAHTHIHTHTISLSHSLTLSHTQTHPCARSLSLMRVRARMRSLSLFLSPLALSHPHTPLFSWRATFRSLALARHFCVRMSVCLCFFPFL